MQYSIPQFIDVEDKVVGPLTGKQTIYLLIGGGILLLVFSLFNVLFFFITMLFVAPVTLAFAFWKPKSITVARWLSNIADFYTTPHLYIWRREPEGFMIKARSQKKSSSEKIPSKSVSRNRIRELAWVLDTSASINMPYEISARPEAKIAKKDF